MNDGNGNTNAALLPAAPRAEPRDHFHRARRSPPDGGNSCQHCRIGWASAAPARRRRMGMQRLRFGFAFAMNRLHPSDQEQRRQQRPTWQVLLNHRQHQARWSTAHLVITDSEGKRR